MAELVRNGQPLKLRLQLEDEEPGAFPRVTLLDQVGDEITGSPADLSHIGSGLYVNDSVAMPAIPIVYAQYKTYNDAAYTERHPVHCETQLDVFERDITGEKVDNLESNSAASSGSLDFLSGVLEDSGELQGLIEDPGQLIGLLEDDESLIGFIEDPDTLIGRLYAGDELVGQIHC